MVNWVSSGLKSFDDIIHGLRLGDNVVLQIDDINSYQDIVNSFVAQALKEKKKLIYIRFGKHKPLVKKNDATLYNLDAQSGFESFSHQVHTIINKEGRGVYYVFDCLSDLLLTWATDMMIGNFFMVTCPYLFELDTIAYFAIRRNNHSYKTIARIRETTQLLIDVYNCENNCYIHPLKVWNRYSPTMFLPHLREKGQMTPITSSIDTSRLFKFICKNIPDSSRKILDYWDYLFIKFEELIKNQRPHSEQLEMIERISRIMLTNDKRMISLIKRFFSHEDFLNIKSRIMGTGFIGGKALGMLLARNIILSDKSLEWQNYFEPHDSYYIGSDVFYTYIVQNGLWKLWMEQKTKQGYFEIAKLLKEKMLTGKFPDEITEHFRLIIDYFGQSPIIVRSSSLQEDAFGNAFAGKYESIFLANQGTPEERYSKFVDAVRKIYSSTMNEDALVYRKKRGLDETDEQMALLIQRVSGSYHNRYFFPFCAGVGVSYNSFVWDKDIDPKAGMLRLVFGLGTRAVDRIENDYARIVALDNPSTQPLSGFKDMQRFSQHEVDLLDIQENDLKTVLLKILMKEELDLPLELISVRDNEGTQKLKTLGIKNEEARILNFNKLLSDTSFTSMMKKMLKILEDTYEYPVDIEFTLNFSKNSNPQINLVQCRPIQTKGLGKHINIPDKINDKNVLLRSIGGFMGGNFSQQIKRIIYIDPKGYHELSESEKYSVARLVGQINKTIPDRDQLPVMLLGPGRWGTSTPSLGIPVNFSEINNITVLGELEFLGGNLIPELSFGTHFFHDLVESNIFYLAIFNEKEDVFFNYNWFSRVPEIFCTLIPDEAKYKNIINVYDTSKTNLNIISDVISQKVICYSD